MNPAFVLDCSLTLAWCFEDEATPATVELLDRMGHESAVVPGCWFIEITNVLALAEHHGRITPTKVAEFIALIQGFDLIADDQAPARAFTHILPLCRTHRLTTYDAVYLDLALRHQLPLATVDQSLRKAAGRLGLKVLGR